MRIGLALDAGFDSPQEALGTRLEHCRSLIELAARYPYASAWFGESYPASPSTFHLPDPLLLIAALAAGTRLEIGTGVLLMNAWTPRRLAYETSIADHLTGGRLTIGIAPGAAALRPRLVGEPALTAAGIEDFLVALRRGWLEEISPAPLQHGGPPIVLGGRPVRAARRAARLADGYYASTTHGLSSITRLAQAYVHELGGVRPGRVVVNRLAVIAETDTAAAALADAYLQPTIDRYRRNGSLHLTRPADELTSEELRRELCLIGSPETICEQLHGYEGAGVTDLALRLAPLAMPYEAARESLEGFGTEVLPRTTAVTAPSKPIHESA